LSWIIALGFTFGVLITVPCVKQIFRT